MTGSSLGASRPAVYRTWVPSTRTVPAPGPAAGWSTETSTTGSPSGSLSLASTSIVRSVPVDGGGVVGVGDRRSVRFDVADQHHEHRPSHSMPVAVVDLVLERRECAAPARTTTWTLSPRTATSRPAGGGRITSIRRSVAVGIDVVGEHREWSRRRRAGPAPRRAARSADGWRRSAGRSRPAPRRIADRTERVDGPVGERRRARGAGRRFVAQRGQPGRPVVSVTSADVGRRERVDAQRIPFRIDVVEQHVDVDAVVWSPCRPRRANRRCAG